MTNEDDNAGGGRNTQEKESCRSCLYTGVGTCMALSGYFLSLAMEREEHPKNQTMTKPQHKREDSIGGTNNKHTSSSSRQSPKIYGQHAKSRRIIPATWQGFETNLMKFMQGNPAPKRHRPFLFACSTAWAAAGAYRFYLN